MAHDVKPIALIKSNKLFEYVSQDELQIPFSPKDVLTFSDGDIIYQTGDSAEQIYLIIDGSVKIKHSVAIDGQRIFEKGQGEFFGEKEFMDREARNSSAVATRDSKLFILRRKELNNLFAKHRALLNNIQGIDPTKDEHADFRTTRESYPDEITNLLKTSESSLDPYGYRSPSQSVDLLHGAKEVEKPVETAPVAIAESKPPDTARTEEFPHRFKTTFEDSFTFGDIDKVIDAMDPKPSVEDASDNEVPPVEEFTGFSWDFSSPKKTIEEEIIVTQDPVTEEITDTFSFEDNNIKNLGFHFPDDTVSEEIVGSKTVETGWDFDTIPEIEEPIVEIKSELPEEDEKFSWDFSSPAFEEEPSLDTPEKPAETETPSTFADTLEEKADWNFLPPEEKTKPEEALEETPWHFTIPDEEKNEEPVVETVDPVIENPFSFSPPADVAGRKTEQDLNEKATVEAIPLWELEKLSDDEPIRGGSFDEFGNLIPDTSDEVVFTDRGEEVPEVAEISPHSGEIFRTPNMFETHEDDDQSIHDQMMETDLEGDSLNLGKENEENRFGTQGFNFTAPLEVRQSEMNQEAGVVELVKQDTFVNLTKDNLQLIIEAAKMVNSNVKLDEVLNQIVLAASLITSADRGTLYIVDIANEELWSKIIRGDEIEEIRLKLGQGIAGWVAKTGETVNIKDASRDERFDANIDKVTGYKTKSMLCYAIKNKYGAIIAVIQLLNSKNGVFNDLDEGFLQALSAHIAISLENAELVEQLLKTDRLTSLGKVAKFLISDIKKPILTIKQLAEHIRKKNVSPETNQVLGLMIEQSNIVVDLVLTTLSYSEGKTVLNKKVLGLHRVLDELLDLLAEYVEYRKTKLFKKYGPDVLINVDRRELYQAFFQITKNACDAMPQGGELYVAAKLVDSGDAVQISFKDKGVGIPPTILERIFEPFMAHGKSNGVGLGLPITEKIVKEHEGKVTIESKEGDGTTVMITLPVVKEF